jgi:hypothetical protein
LPEGRIPLAHATVECSFRGRGFKARLERGREGPVGVPGAARKGTTIRCAAPRASGGPTRTATRSRTSRRPGPRRRSGR